MPPANAPTETPFPHTIEYLSPPAEVSMADRWFEIASIDHFWVQRRFEVLRRLAAGLILNSREMAEVGCGHGLLQKQIEDTYQRELTGFDLNEFALKQSSAVLSKVCCYDVYRVDPRLQARFDLILLFDVLEHISNEDGFLKAILFHLNPRGRLIINVPAGQWAFSSYDIAAGHVRRYSIHTLGETAARNGLQIQQWSYWGLPLVPILVLRKLWLMGQQDQSKIITAGFHSRSPSINKALGIVSKCELIPQKFLGTSLMAVLAVGTTAPNAAGSTQAPK